MQAAFAAHQLLLFGGAGAERLFLGTGNSADPPPPFHVPSYPPTPHYPPAPQPLTCPFAAPTEAPPLPRAASRCAPMAPPSAVPRGWGKGGGGGERRERSAALRGAAAAGTESGPTGRVVVAGGGRRLHNSPVAARRFLRGEVRAARPAPLPGIGPSAAGGERWRSGEAGRSGLAWRGGGPAGSPEGWEVLNPCRWVLGAEGMWGDSSKREGWAQGSCSLVCPCMRALPFPPPPPPRPEQHIGITRGRSVPHPQQLCLCLGGIWGSPISGGNLQLWQPQ